MKHLIYLENFNNDALYEEISSQKKTDFLKNTSEVKLSFQEVEAIIEYFNERISKSGLSPDDYNLFPFYDDTEPDAYDSPFFNVEETRIRAYERCNYIIFMADDTSDSSDLYEFHKYEGNNFIIFYHNNEEEETIDKWFKCDGIEGVEQFLKNHTF
jgi:hypothetical protein